LLALLEKNAPPGEVTMSASSAALPALWPEGFWDRLERLESRHQRVQTDYDKARRGLERLTSEEAEEVRAAWRHYCEVIAELDATTAEFETLHR
jgi:hypothetical protein